MRERIGLFSLAARSWIDTMNITKYKKKLGLMSWIQFQTICYCITTLHKLFTHICPALIKLQLPQNLG